MTERLYYRDSYLTAFRARVVDASPDRQRIYLDRTAFYPASGGQPFDLGALGGIAVTEVIDEGERIAHVLNEPMHDMEAAGAVDWPRRFDHMQQHTGQHLLSAALVELFDAPTVGFHLGAGACTIEVAAAPGQGPLDAARIGEAERRANEIVFQNRPVTVTFEDSSQPLGLRKTPAREGEVRIVSIEGLDRCACGGTHVRATGEIGPILIRGVDRVRGNTRLEFLCGGRAVRRARADYEALSAIARRSGASLDETAALVEAQAARLQESEKARRRMSAELAEARGRERYLNTAPRGDGTRAAVVRVKALAEDLRAEAQSFAAHGKAVFLALAEEPPSALLAVSKDGGMHAGEALRRALAEAGGRGGGSAALAQGSAPSIAALDAIAGQLGFE